MPDEEDLEIEESAAPHALWSGAITFGLLSLPVDLFPASRTHALPLKLVDKEHHLLARRYFCPAHERFLPRDEIVRGYEIEKDEFVIVTDQELESIAPEKSRTIDLRKFVNAAEIGPLYFKRSYFLTPGQGGARAYRLLAETMERSKRAGVATFVMRGKEYLVALLSEKGILRADTLRFEDEIRSVEEVGLSFAGSAPASRVAEFRRAVGALEADDLDLRELEDSYTEHLRELIERKLERGIDVEQPPEPEESEGGEGEIIDLMEVLKRRLRPEAAEPAPAAERTSRRPSERAAGKASGRKRAGAKRAERRGAERAAEERTSAQEAGESGALEQLSRDDLYEKAKALRVPGRSRMDKEQLIEALREARR
ncbi:MAG TPA: Ku protein [Gammaproteobacteria bacterium]|nr:Ku protein [Gammaproteobacteria bacterium]